MSKKSDADLGPLNYLIDLAGAAVMRSVVKNRIVKDYKRGQGEESVKAAALVFGHQAMHSGSDGMIGLGGLYGVNGAIKEIERQEASAAHVSAAPADSISVYSSPANDNSEAWKLNTEDGRAYGLDPNDFATRESYISALNELKAFKGKYEIDSEPAFSVEETIPDLGEVHTYCKVSLLTTGKNKYYLADNINVSVGSTVKVQDGSETVNAIVLTVEQHSAATAPVDPDAASQIVSL